MIVLVTGGLGFIGSELVRQLDQLGAEVRIIDNGYYGKCKKLLDEWDCRYTLYEDTINNRELVREVMQGVDYVFHLGALISVADSFRIPEEYEYVNVQGTIVLLQEAVAAGVKSFIFSSSSANYGNTINPEKIETMQLEPVSPYAMTKVHAEDYCELFNNTNNMNVVSLRYFNVFGLNQDAMRPYAACVANFFERASRGEELIIYGTGEQTRSFVHVEDVARANIYCASEGLQGIYNVGYDQEVSINQVANEMKKLFGDLRIVYDEPRKGDVARMYCNPQKLFAEGFRFKYSFESGLEYMFQEYKQKDNLQ